MTTKKFKVSSLRTVKSPSDPSVSTYFTWVNFRDLPDSFSLEVNPRKPKMNTSVAKQLIQAVVDSESVFDINNRGIVITAKNVKFDTSDSQITIDLDDDKQKYGILDGGHTYTAIIENRDKVEDDINKYVRLEIIVGENVDVTRLADARNTSTQVSDIALFELDDKFGFVKDALKDQTYAENIAYKDNDNKDIPIAELLKLMYAFNIKRFPDDTKVPIASYSGKASVFKDYKKAYAHGENNIYIQLAKELPKLVKLYELINREMKDKYNRFKSDDGKKGKFGAVRGIKPKPSGYLSEFTKEPTDYDIPSGFMMPIFGAFRSLLKFVNDDNIADGVEWEFDPIDVWNNHGVELVQNTFDTDTHPNLAGKNKTLWQGNYRIIDGYKKDLLIEKLLKDKENQAK